MGNEFKSIIDIITRSKTTETALGNILKQLQQIKASAADAGAALDLVTGKGIGGGGGGNKDVLGASFMSLKQEILAGMKSGSGYRGPGGTFIKQGEAEMRAVQEAIRQISGGNVAGLTMGGLPIQSHQFAQQQQRQLTMGSMPLGTLRNAMNPPFVPFAPAPPVAQQYAPITPTPYSANLQQYAGAQRMLNLPNTQQIQQAQQALNQLGITTNTATKEAGFFEQGWGRQIRTIASGMAIWQGMNMVISAVVGTMGQILQETMTLDSASATLAITMDTSRESADGYAQSINKLGVQFGQLPAESQAAMAFISRSTKDVAGQTAMYESVSKLSTVTGSDINTLVDNIDRLNRQWGVTAEESQRSAEVVFQAWKGTPVPIDQFTRALAEVAPSGISAGKSMEEMSDLMSRITSRTGDVSGAVNTFTRLISAIQDPTNAQIDTFSRLGISFTDLDGNIRDTADILDEFTSKAGQLNPEDIYAIGGRKPQVLNDFKVMLDEMTRSASTAADAGRDMNDAFAEKANTSAMAVDRLNASWAAFLGTLGSTQAVLEILDVLKDDLAMLAALMEGPGEGEGLISSAVKKVQMQAGIEKGKELFPNAPGMTAMGGLPFAFPSTVTPAGGEFAGGGGGTDITPVSNFLQKMYSGAVQTPTSGVDITKYSDAEFQEAMSRIPQMQQELIDSMVAFWEAQGMSPEKIETMKAAQIQMIEDTVTAYEKLGKDGYEFLLKRGPEAFFGPQALQQQDAMSKAQDITWKDLEKVDPSKFGELASRAAMYQGMQEQMAVQAGMPKPETQQFGLFMGQGRELKGLNTTMMALMLAINDLTETEKKSQQLEGAWNIPTGARVLVPLESMDLLKREDTGGGGGISPEALMALLNAAKLMETETATTVGGKKTPSVVGTPSEMGEPAYGKMSPEEWVEIMTRKEAMLEPDITRYGQDETQKPWVQEYMDRAMQAMALPGDESSKPWLQDLLKPIADFGSKPIKVESRVTFTRTPILVNTSILLDAREIATAVHLFEDAELSVTVNQEAQATGVYAQ